jgi:hypothetical protein
MAVRSEARSLVGFLLGYLDAKVVDEAIGRCEMAEEGKRPRRPRGILPGVRERAEKYGVFMPGWLPDESGSM